MTLSVFVSGDVHAIQGGTSPAEKERDRLATRPPTKKIMLVDNVVTCQCAGLDTSLSPMCGRLFLTLVLALTCLMIAIAPVATMALDDHVACKQQSAPVALTGTHVHDGHHMLPSEPASDADDSVAFFLCCSQGCIFDLPLFVDTGPSEASFTGILAAWTVTGLVDLTDQNGLRRPPRA